MPLHKEVPVSARDARYIQNAFFESFHETPGAFDESKYLLPENDLQRLMEVEEPDVSDEPSESSALAWFKTLMVRAISHIFCMTPSIQTSEELSQGQGLTSPKGKKRNKLQKRRKL